MNNSALIETITKAVDDVVNDRCGMVEERMRALEERVVTGTGADIEVALKVLDSPGPPPQFFEILGIPVNPRIWAHHITLLRENQRLKERIEVLAREVEAARLENTRA